jgi:hypothetical protein
MALNRTTNRLRCDKDGLRLGYLTCVHVMAGEPIAHHIAPDPTALTGADMLGEALCAACMALPQLVKEDILVVCERCVMRVARMA